MKTMMLVLALLAPVESLDVSVQRWSQEARRPPLEGAAHFLSDRVGRPVVMLSALLAMCVLGGPAGIETARVAILTLIPVNLAVEGLKRATFRTRPDGERKRSNASFPSSHTANVMALAVVLGWRWRRLAPWMGLLAVLVAYSRIYLNRHWLTDVLAGALIGVGCAGLVIALWQRRKQSGPRGLAET